MRAPPRTADGRPRAFFGRRSGKALHKGQRALYEARLPELSVPAGETPLVLAALFPDAKRFVLEIGYGGGEHLARQALNAPDTGFIGCEVFSGGIAKMVEAIDRHGIGNVALYADDALGLLARLPDGALEAVYLLYPDPWPKMRHHKRRFISALTLSEIARVLRPGGRFHVATDIEDYANWTLAHVLREPSLVFAPDRPGSWHEPFAGWVPTRYEEKARREGRMVSFYFAFERV